MTAAVSIEDVRRGREAVRAYRQQVWARRDAEAAAHPAESHPALRETRSELEKFDTHRERYEQRDRVHHMTRIGMSEQEIADVIGITDKTVEREKKRLPAPQRPRLYNAGLASEERITQLESTADLALYLATVLRDEDPGIVWGSLTRLDRRQLQELAVTALAAIPVDSTPAALLGWVTELPAARA